MITEERTLNNIVDDLSTAKELIDAIIYVIRRDNMISEAYVEEKLSCAKSCVEYGLRVAETDEE
jgi:hypothetical protein